MHLYYAEIIELAEGIAVNGPQPKHMDFKTGVISGCGSTECSALYGLPG
jgi:hypothetical protein